MIEMCWTKLEPYKHTSLVSLTIQQHQIWADVFWNYLLNVWRTKRNNTTINAKIVAVFKGKKFRFVQLIHVLSFVIRGAFKVDQLISPHALIMYLQIYIFYFLTYPYVSFLKWYFTFFRLKSGFKSKSSKWQWDNVADRGFSSVNASRKSIQRNIIWFSKIKQQKLINRAALPPHSTSQWESIKLCYFKQWNKYIPSTSKHQWPFTIWTRTCVHWYLYRKESWWTHCA